MQKLTDDFVRAVLRKKGERRLSVGGLANEAGVNRSTISRVLKANTTVTFVQIRTYTALANWIARNA